MPTNLDGPVLDDCWTFPARPVNVLDGDTIEVTVDLGFHIRRDVTLRLAKVDTAEIHFVSHDSEEYRRGQAHAEFVEGWLDEAQVSHDGDWPLRVYTAERGKYGRYLAWVRRPSDSGFLNAVLLEEFGDDVRY